MEFLASLFIFDMEVAGEKGLFFMQEFYYAVLCSYFVYPMADFITNRIKSAIG